MLDGKNPLVFQFRRGIVSRQPRRKEESENEDGGNAKSEEEQ